VAVVALLLVEVVVKEINSGLHQEDLLFHVAILAVDQEVDLQIERLMFLVM
jgi:hypothetical protein